VEGLFEQTGRAGQYLIAGALSGMDVADGLEGDRDAAGMKIIGHGLLPSNPALQAI
jgi:hypothetical protein